MRLFIAVNIPNELKEKIYEIQGTLKSSGAGVKWVEKDNLHITLKFLGDVEEQKLASLIDALGMVVKDVKPFVLSLAGTGGFPNSKYPRIIWLGINGGGECLQGIAGKIENAFGKLGFPREAKGFSPHITIGRVRSRKNLERLAGTMDKYKDTSIGKYTVGCIDIMQSRLLPSGPSYKCLKSISI